MIFKISRVDCSRAVKTKAKKYKPTDSERKIYWYYGDQPDIKNHTSEFAAADFLFQFDLMLINNPASWKIQSQLLIAWHVLYLVTRSTVSVSGVGTSYRRAEGRCSRGPGECLCVMESLGNCQNVQCTVCTSQTNDVT